MSDEVIDVFVKKIIKEKIKSPTRADFSLEKWNKEWAKVEEISSERDKKVYTMGLIIDSLLRNVRDRLSELYKRAPKTNYERLMISYVASSNRTSAVAIKLAKETPAIHAHQILLVTNNAGNKQSLGEVAHAAVDGFQLAIRQCLKGIEKKDEIELSVNPINEMAFIQYESWLSQLYWTYLHLWQCVLWADYDLIEIDRENKLFRIEQPNIPSEVAFMNSSDRKEKLAGQVTIMAMQPKVSSRFINDKYVVVARGNKKKVARVAFIRNADNDVITLNTQWRLSQYDLYNYFPEKWLNDDYGNGFCLSEVMEVMRCLMLIANSENEKYPEDDSAYNVNKLREFCPTVQANSLVHALCDATGIIALKINKIIEISWFIC